MKLKGKARQIIKVLKVLADAQGFASVGIAWDGSCGPPTFDIYASRERDGLLLQHEQLTENEFVSVIIAACEEKEEVGE